MRLLIVMKMGAEKWMSIQLCTTPPFPPLPPHIGTKPKYLNPQKKNISELWHHILIIFICYTYNSKLPLKNFGYLFVFFSAVLPFCDPMWCDCVGAVILFDVITRVLWFWWWSFGCCGDAIIFKWWWLFSSGGDDFQYFLHCRSCDSSGWVAPPCPSPQNPLSSDPSPHHHHHHHNHRHYHHHHHHNHHYHHYHHY